MAIFFYSFISKLLSPLFFFFFQVDRASVFPHGRNLNLLILTVVGASATASLLVGGLIFILAKRSRSAKKINKLQLSDDDAEDRVKVQEEYKVSSNLFWVTLPTIWETSDGFRLDSSESANQSKPFSPFVDIISVESLLRALSK